MSESGNEWSVRKESSTRLVQTAVRVVTILGSRSGAFVGALGLVAGRRRLSRSSTIVVDVNLTLQRPHPMTPTKLVATIALLLSLAACANGAGQK